MQIAAVGVLSAAVGMGGVAFLGGNQPEEAAKQAATARLENQVLLQYLLASPANQQPAEGEDGAVVSRLLSSRVTDDVNNATMRDLLATLHAQSRQPESGLRTREFTPPVEEGWGRAEDIRVTVEATTTWRGLVEMVVKGGQGVNVRWDKMQEVGIDPNQPLGVVAKDSTLGDVLREAARTVQLPGGQAIALRLQGDTLAIGLEQEFDRLELTLVTYDLSPIVERRGVAQDEPEKIDEVTNGVIQVVQGLVFPDFWRDNGGDLAEVHRFGSKLFIKAPKRYHGHIRWVMDELLAEPESKAGAMRIETHDVVPVLGDLPLLNRYFSANQQHAMRRGPVLIRVVDGKVELTGPDSRVLANEVRLFPDGSLEAGPEAGAWLETQMTLAYSPASGEVPMTQAIPVERMKADEMRELLGKVLNIVPRLKECPVERSLGIAPGDGEVLEIGATAKQIGEIQEIVRALDANVPAETNVMSSTQTFTLQRIEANAVRELLGEWFNKNPTLKECAVDRMLLVNAPNNQLELKATTEQVNAVARLIQIMDADLR